ncbi:hypothetical protein [Chromobacterium sp. IIBBL 290-4]|uniref:hypothetical protein n=1 Tax=Chromobacterium sp. IIBBL 290-4 TaxID=2953890 RepID=UPI0020B89B2B|nr:hypothetical protein [Chromobacterium sp. IIBBL 290-4]UTH73585.1 hypothetical protein NKT35_18890 [Chromobacterium sp. IIBBL 290-4]
MTGNLIGMPIPIEQCQALVVQSAAEYAAVQKAQHVDWAQAGVYWSFSFSMVIASFVMAKAASFLFRPFRNR